MAIGARSQAARTYLEKFLDSFKECDLEELVKHGLRALRDTLPNEVELSNKNVSISVVGKDTPFTIYDDAGVEPFLAGMVAATGELIVSTMRMFYQIAKVGMEMYVPLGSALAAMVFGLGVVMGIYIPFLIRCWL